MRYSDIYTYALMITICFDVIIYFYKRSSLLDMRTLSQVVPEKPRLRNLPNCDYSSEKLSCKPINHNAEKALRRNIKDAKVVE